MRRLLLAISAALLLVAVLALHAQSRAAAGGEPVTLLPTIHPSVPTDLSQIWLAPDRSAASARTPSPMATVIKLQAGGDYTRAFTAATQAATQQGALAQYASLPELHRWPQTFERGSLLHLRVHGEPVTVALFTGIISDIDGKSPRQNDSANRIRVAHVIPAREGAVRAADGRPSARLARPLAVAD